jgi:hypothetical protein
MLLNFCYSLVLGIILNFIIIELLYYVWCMMCDDWALYQELFIYLCTFTCSTSTGIGMNINMK